MALVGSPSSVLSKGIGSWGSLGLLLTRGLGIEPTAGVPATIEETIDFGFTDDMLIDYNYTQSEQVPFV